ncbi:hypothetical protein BJX99DRAFT_61627 [Aspergillus californicus]
MPHNPISFEPNGLYILLSDLGSEWQFHWAFYLAMTAHSGRILHLINNIDTDHVWKYVSRFMVGVPKTSTLLVALKIAVMDPVLHEPLDSRLAAVSQAPPVTCRTWLRRALEILDDEGFIKLTGCVEDLELEVESKAVGNRAMNCRTAEVSELIVA